MTTYTVFLFGDCGTVWIGPVEAEDGPSAVKAGMAQCAEAWLCPVDDVQFLGLAKGRVHILYWNDDALA